MITEIQQWLTEQPYWEGVELYTRYGESDMLKRIFAGSGSPFNKRQLATELQQLLDAACLAKANEPVIPDAPGVSELREKAASLFDQRSALKAQARLLINQGHRESPELQEIAHKLAFDIRHQLDNIFGRIQYAQVNGSLPETDAVASLSIAEMIKRRNTLRTYLSRSKDPSKLDQWKAEAFQLDLKIKELEQ